MQQGPDISYSHAQNARDPKISLKTAGDLEHVYVRSLGTCRLGYRLEQRERSLKESEFGVEYNINLITMERSASITLDDRAALYSVVFQAGIRV